MTYDEATALCRTGKPIRHPDMSKGWKIVAGGDALFCINPHTGSDYQFIALPADLARNDWQCIDNSVRHEKTRRFTA